MHTRPMSSCQRLSALFRGALPGPVLCALVAFLLPAHALAQGDRPTRPSPAPGPPAMEVTDGGGALPVARGGGPALESLAGPRLASTGADEALLVRALIGSFAGEGSGPDLSSLQDVLPRALYRDVVHIKDRMVRLRSRVFGRRGIVSVGDADEDGDLGRLRLNLQHSPDPGIRFTLVTH